MAKIVSLSSASANPRARNYRVDWRVLQITLDGNLLSTADVMEAKAGQPGYVQMYQYDLDGQIVMSNKVTPATIQVRGRVSIIGPAKAPCAFCNKVRNVIKKWWTK